MRNVTTMNDQEMKQVEEWGLKDFLSEFSAVEGSENE